MKYNKLVSVVMPVHNGERFLREAIESVLNQTYTNFEFLIVENCSTDSSVEIIKSYNDPRISLIIEEDCGIVQGYNRGFKEAKGEYILVHDHDDVSLHHRIESLINYAVKNNLDICGSSIDVINYKSEFVRKVKFPLDKVGIINRILYDGSTLFNPTLLIREKTMKELEYFDYNHQFGADYDFVLRSLKANKIGNHPEVLLKYRVHKNSTSRKNSKLCSFYTKEMAFKFYDEFIPFFNDKDFVLARMYYFFEHYLTASKYFMKSIYKNGFSKETLKYLSYSTIFILLIILVRKNDLNNNRFFNIVKKLFVNKNYQ